MAFDPTAPFQLVDSPSGETSDFDPSKPFKLLEPNASADLTVKLIPRPSPTMFTTLGGNPVPADVYDKPQAQREEDIKTGFVTPAVPIPKFTVNKNDSKTVAVGKEAVNLLAGIPEFIESPAGIATLPVGGFAPKAVAGLFGADALKNAGERIIQAHKDWNNYSPSEKAVAVTDIAGQLGFAGLLGHGAIKGIPSGASPEIQGPPAMGSMLKAPEGYRQPEQGPSPASHYPPSDLEQPAGPSHAEEITPPDLQSMVGKPTSGIPISRDLQKQINVSANERAAKASIPEVSPDEQSERMSLNKIRENGATTISEIKKLLGGKLSNEEARRLRNLAYQSDEELKYVQWLKTNGKLGDFSTALRQQETPLTNKGGAQEDLSPEQQAISKQNNSRAAFEAAQAKAGLPPLPSTESPAVGQAKLPAAEPQLNAPVEKSPDAKLPSASGQPVEGKVVNPQADNPIQPKVESPVNGNIPAGKAVSTRGEDVLRAAVEKRLIDNLPDLPTHEKMNVASEVAKAVDFVKSNPEEAMKIAKGESVHPTIKSESIYTAIEEKAMRDGDAETLKTLSESSVPTEAGQRLKLLDSNDPHSPVKIMRDIRQARESAGEARAKTTKDRVVKEIKTAMRKVSSKRQTWEDVVGQLICRN